MDDGSTFGECLMDIINSQTLIHPVTGAKFSMANVIVFATANHWAINELLDASSMVDGVQAHLKFTQHPLYRELQQYRFNQTIDTTYFHKVESIMTPLISESLIAEVLARKLFNIGHEGYYRFIRSKCPIMPFFDFDRLAASELFSSTVRRMLPKDLNIVKGICNTVSDKKFCKEGDGVLSQFVVEAMSSLFNKMLSSTQTDDNGYLDARRVEEYAKKYVRANFRICSTGKKRVVSAVQTIDGDSTDDEIRTTCVNENAKEEDIFAQLRDAKVVKTDGC